MAVPPLKCDVCGEGAFPANDWIHAKHGGKLVVNTVVNTKPLVVNKEAVLEHVVADKPLVVPSRTKDRHKNKEARLEYARNWMRSKRASNPR